MAGGAPDDSHSMLSARAASALDRLRRYERDNGLDPAVVSDPADTIGSPGPHHFPSGASERTLPLSEYVADEVAGAVPLSPAALDRLEAREMGGDGPDDPLAVAQRITATGQLWTILAADGMVWAMAEVGPEQKVVRASGADFAGAITALGARLGEPACDHAAIVPNDAWVYPTICPACGDLVEAP